MLPRFHNALARPGFHAYMHPKTYSKLIKMIANKTHLLKQAKLRL
jgi:hypothetical protein